MSTTNQQPTIQPVIMTKYEKAKIIGLRASQIDKNSLIFVDTKGETNSARIAQMELRQGRLPMSVRRYRPDGSYEDISVNDMIIP